MKSILNTKAKNSTLAEQKTNQRIVLQAIEKANLAIEAGQDLTHMRIELSFRSLRLELARTAEKWFEHIIKKWITLHGAPMEEVRTVRNRFVSQHRRFSDVEVTEDREHQRGDHRAVTQSTWFHYRIYTVKGRICTV